MLVSKLLAPIDFHSMFFFHTMDVDGHSELLATNTLQNIPSYVQQKKINSQVCNNLKMSKAPLTPRTTTIKIMILASMKKKGS